MLLPTYSEVVCRARVSLPVITCPVSSPSHGFFLNQAVSSLSSSLIVCAREMPVLSTLLRASHRGVKLESESDKLNVRVRQES